MKVPVTAITTHSVTKEQPNMIHNTKNSLVRILHYVQRIYILNNNQKNQVNVSVVAFRKNQCVRLWYTKNILLFYYESKFREVTLRGTTTKET